MKYRSYELLPSRTGRTYITEAGFNLSEVLAGISNRQEKIINSLSMPNGTLIIITLGQDD